MRHRIRRTLAVALATTALTGTVVLGGCSTPPGPGAGDSKASDFKLPDGPKKGNLSVVTKYGNKLYAPYFNAIAKGYEKENPGVHVTIQNAGDQAYKDKVRVLAAGKKLPDVYFSWPGAFAEQFIDAGYATDLSPVLKGTDWGKTFSSAAMKTVEKNGKVFGVPITLDAKVWAYYKPAFKKAGLKQPKSFADLVGSCPALKKAGYQPVAFGNQDGWPAVQYLTQLIPQNVPMKTVLKDYRGAKGGFTHPGYIKALKDFQKVIKACAPKGTNAVSDQTVTENFMEGKSAMYFTETVNFGQFTEKAGAQKDFEKKWGFFRNPNIAGAKGDQSVLAGAPDTFMINSQSKNKALAADFLKYMTTKQNGQKMLDDIGWLSPVKGSSDEAKTIDQQHELADLIDNTDTMAVWLDTAAAPDVAQAFLAGAEGLLDGSLTPEQVMKKVRATSS